MRRKAIQAAVVTCMAMAMVGSVADVPPFVVTQRALMAAVAVYLAMAYVLPPLLELVIAIGGRQDQRDRPNDPRQPTTETEAQAQTPQDES
jgi:hypothetical protein